MRHDSIDERLLEAMEVCRPASDDLADPALAELAVELGRNHRLEIVFARLQKVDVVLAGAIQDVPVPAGLADRLMAALAVPAVAAALLPAEVVAQSPVQPARRPARLSSRAWLFSLSGAIAAMVLIAVGWFQRSQVEYSPTSVLEAAVDFFNNDAHEQGELLASVSPPWGFPASRCVPMTDQTRWRKVGAILHTGGVAYELTGPGGVQATLYVVRRSVAGLPDQPPARPVYGTARCCSAAWQEGPLLYVLVVVGESSDYQRLVSVSQGPLA